MIENSFQKIFWQFGFGATIGDVKRLVGVPVGMTLEPVTEEDDYPQAGWPMRKTPAEAPNRAPAISP